MGDLKDRHKTPSSRTHATSNLLKFERHIPTDRHTDSSSIYIKSNATRKRKTLELFHSRWISKIAAKGCDRRLSKNSLYGNLYLRPSNFGASSSIFPVEASLYHGPEVLLS